MQYSKCVIWQGRKIWLKWKDCRSSLVAIAKTVYNWLYQWNNRYRYADSAFDRKYGTGTSGMIMPEDFNLADSTSKDGAQCYWATPDRLDEYLLEALALDFREYTFVDYGSRKGRVLLVASSFPFREIIDVEFNPELHKVAEENVKTYYSKRQRCKKILPLCIDALESQLP